MLKPHEKSFINSIGKKIAPVLSRLIYNTKMNNMVTLSSFYLSILQGKGSGTGWDMDSEIKTAISNIHRNDAVIFDVGANKGDWSKKFQEFYKAESLIFQFEPTQYCCNIIKNKNMKNCKLIEAAVSDKNGEVIILSSSSSSGISSIHSRRDSYFQNIEYKEEKVQSVTIDSIIEKYNIETIDFMKMDIEGHEFMALKGATKALSDGRIKALTFEFGSANINSRTYFHDFWDILNSNGYKIKRICPGGILLDVKEYYEDLEFFRGASNYLAILN